MVFLITSCSLLGFLFYFFSKKRSQYPDRFIARHIRSLLLISLGVSVVVTEIIVDFLIDQLSTNMGVSLLEAIVLALVFFGVGIGMYPEIIIAQPGQAPRPVASKLALFMGAILLVLIIFWITKKYLYSI